MPKQVKEEAKCGILPSSTLSLRSLKQGGKPAFWLNACGNITLTRYHFGDILFVKY